MSCRTLRSGYCTRVCVCVDKLSDFTTTVLYTFLLFQQPGQLSRNPGGGKCVFLLHNVRPGTGAHPASYSMDTGVKHSGREVYHLSPPTAEVMNEWSCIYFPPFPSYHERGLFLIFHMRATFRTHHVVVMRLLCSVKLPSFKFLPAATSPVHTFSRHTILLSSPPLSASPAHHASFVYRDNNNGEGHHLAGFSVLLYFSLTYPHPRSPYARHEGMYGEWRYSATHS